MNSIIVGLSLPQSSLTILSLKEKHVTNNWLSEFAKYKEGNFATSS